MADDYEERARVFFADGMPDATTIGEYERRLAVMLREVANERERISGSPTTRRYVDGLEAERDQLRAELATERDRYAALRAKLARRVDLHDADGRALHTERERVERLRVVAEYAKWVRTDAGDVVPGLSRALDALLPGDLEPSGE